MLKMPPPFLPYSVKYYDLLLKSGTAEAYLGRPTFKSGTARPTAIGPDAYENSTLHV